MIKSLYLVHHSHTDIGYTDYQERIIFNHVNLIRTLKSKMVEGFKWNCETLFCVEQFLREASEEEKDEFFSLVREGRVGLSATYLNFTDLADIPHLTRRVQSIQQELRDNGIELKVAMNADVNGISLGNLDSYLDCGVEFFYTNIHCHHGQYPLFQNQKPYYWKSLKTGRRLLVWNGEHYNLGNALGFTYTKKANFMVENYFGERLHDDVVLNAVDNVRKYIADLESSGYDKSFIISSVSGVFSDNAPANPLIPAVCKGVQEAFGGKLEVRMVTLSELYELIKDECKDAPEYTGDLNDWWSYGVASNPYATKHYLEAKRLQKKAELLADEGVLSSELTESYVDNALIYAEHTFGHSATVSDPCETMVKNLEFRKNSYASRANESANKNLLRVISSHKDSLTYYDREGHIRAINKGEEKDMLVSFYIECWPYDLFEVTAEDGRKIECQTSKHPRGALVTFYDHFKSGEEKRYAYKEVYKPIAKINSRTAYSGSERVRDIVNSYDSVSYKLPYGIENDFYCIRWEIGGRITSVYDKKSGRELLEEGEHSLFNPVYEVTETRTDLYEERRLFGRNIRGQHSKKYNAVITGVVETEVGPTFNSVLLEMELEGLKKLQLFIKLYNREAKMDISLKVYKNLVLDPESLFLPVSLKGFESVYFNKGGSYFRPGVDQLPGTCMEYYLLTDGVVYDYGDVRYALGLMDAPMVYTGEMKHHPIRLCENKLEDNRRPVYSWIMNNNWETNFPLDLCGITEYRYTLKREEADVEKAFRNLSIDSLDSLVTMEKNVL